MHSSGDAGGRAYTFNMPSSICSFDISPPQTPQVGNDPRPVGRGQPLGRQFSLLRCVETDPDQPRIGIAFPQPEEFLEISLAPGLLACHRAVDGDLVAGNVLEDAVVGGGLPALVVLRWKAVNRHHNLKPPQRRPFDRGSDALHSSRAGCECRVRPAGEE